MDCMGVFNFLKEGFAYSSKTEEVLKHVLGCQDDLCSEVETALMEFFEAVSWDIRGEKGQAKRVAYEAAQRLSKTIKAIEGDQQKTKEQNAVKV